MQELESASRDLKFLRLFDCWNFSSGEPEKAAVCVGEIKLHGRLHDIA